MPSTEHLRGWLSVGSVAFGTFVLITTEFLPIGLLTSIAKDLAVSEGSAGLMVTTPGVVAAFAAPATAHALKKIDRRVLLLALTFLVLASNCISMLCEGFGTMLFARLLLGVAVGGFWAIAGAVGRRLVDERYGGTATAVVLAGISVGTVIGLPLGSVIGSLAGWRAAFQVGAALSGAALVAQWLLLPTLRPNNASWNAGLRAVLGVPMIRAGFALAALVTLGHFAAYTYLEPYLRQQAGLDTSWLGLALAGYGCAGLAGNFVGARLAERHVRGTFQVTAALLGLAILALVAAHRSTVGTLLSVIAWGAAFGAIPACVQIWLYQASPKLFEASSALMVTVFQAALATGAWAGGLTTDRLGQQNTMLAGAVVLAIAVAAIWRPAR